jgi:dTDP-4-dehydrorhamnose 3,5-epimerase
MINDIIITPLKKIPDERGMIMHFIKSTDKNFKSFGEVYFATAYPGVIKGWHLHKKQEQNYCVIQGMIKLVLFDNRKDSHSKGQLQEIFIGENNYCVVKIPPGIINGWKCIGDKTAILANFSDLPHDPTEMERIDPISNNIPYNWNIVMK